MPLYAVEYALDGDFSNTQEVPVAARDPRAAVLRAVQEALARCGACGAEVPPLKWEVL